MFKPTVEHQYFLAKCSYTPKRLNDIYMIYIYLYTFEVVEILSESNIFFTHVNQKKGGKPTYGQQNVSVFLKENITLPETNSSPLKMDGWKTSFLSFWVSASWQVRTVRFQGG